MTHHPPTGGILMSPSFSFFDQEALAAPEFSVAAAEDLVRARYGIDGVATELGSQQDANFRIVSPAGVFVLKVSNPAFTADDLDAQDRAAAHVAQCFEIRVPQPVPGVDGHTIQPVTLDGQSTVARLVSYIEGDSLSASEYLAPPIVAALGELAGAASRALASFAGPVPPRELQWDLRNAREVVFRLAKFVSVPGGAEAAREAARTAAEALAPFADQLPVQAVHGDLTVDNVIATLDEDGRRRPVGVIDFGDLMWSWGIAELAVTCSSLLPYAGDDLSVVLPAIRAFDQVRPITDDELNALWPLVVLRAASLMVSGRHQASIDDANQYAAENLDWEWRIFEAATALPISGMTELVRSAIRPQPARPVAAGQRIIADRACVPVDLSTTSPALHDGRFLDDDAETRLAAHALSGAADLAYVPYLQARLTRTRLNSVDPPATVGLGVELFVTEPLEIRAPWPGTVEVGDDAVALRGAHNQTLWLSGSLQDAKNGDILWSGDLIGRLVTGVTGGTPTSLRVQVSRLGNRPPFFVPAAMADAWARVCPDPTPLIDPDGHGDARMADTLLARRSASFAPVQEHYFTEPPRIERDRKSVV